MALIVQKYGGTSVGSVERIKNVARRIAKWQNAGHQVVVVVSAMSGETNRLIALAKEIQKNPDPRELDVIASTGEQVTIGLLAMALQNLGVPARSYTGTQVRVLTDNAFTKARIKEIDSHRIMADLNDGKVVIVAGFQGCDEEGNITTLGRGGSDTSAVALAAALHADECLIFTDVDGITQLIRAWSATLANWMLWRLRKFWKWPPSAPRFFRSAVWNLLVNTAFRPACSPA